MQHIIHLYILDFNMLKKVYILFMSVILITPLVLLILSSANNISVSEKRVLATWPQLNFKTYLNGSWSKGVDEYIDDHFMYRPQLINIASFIRHNMGFHLSNQEKIVHIDLKSLIDSENKEEPDTVPNMSYLNDFQEAYDGSLLVLNGAIYTLNTGNPKVSPLFAKMLSEYAQKFEGKVRVFSCVAPLSSAFIPAEKYARYNAANRASLDAIRDNLTDGAIFCDVLSELNKHAYEKLFFGTDHHWTAKGAYYGYVAFCSAAGLTPVPLSEMTQRYKYPFYGTLYELTRDATVRQNPDTMEYFMPNVATTAVRYNATNFKSPIETHVFCENCSGGGSYSTFLCGDVPLLKITTGTKNGRKAALIKNSMGNAFAVYLISHYEEIFVFDFRYSYHNLIDVIEKNNIYDLIFGLGMYGAMTPGTINMMRKMATNKGIMPKIELPADTLNPAKPLDTLHIPDVIDTLPNILSKDTLSVENDEIPIIKNDTTQTDSNK